MCGFCTEQAAIDYKSDLESDRRRGTWLDPSGFKTTLAEWVQRWWPSLDLDVRTLENYESCLRLHILPRFGHVPMGDITTLDINLWIKESGEPSETRRKGYAPSTIRTWINVLSMILTDAVDQRLIPANPVHKRRRRGRRCRNLRPERIWATPEEVLRIADQAVATRRPGSSTVHHHDGLDGLPVGRGRRLASAQRAAGSRGDRRRSGVRVVARVTG